MDRDVSGTPADWPASPHDERRRRFEASKTPPGDVR